MRRDSQSRNPARRLQESENLAGANESGRSGIELFHSTLPFPDHWRMFSPKDKIGDWLEMYAKVMELNYWHSTECRGAQYRSDTQDWTVTVDRGGKTVVFRPK